MKIYTKTGDKGQTSLIGGTRVSKADPRLDAYGTVDELNAAIGFLIAGIHVNTINKNLSSLNAVYELQLKGVQAGNDELSAQIEHQKALSTNVEQLNASLGASLKDSEEYKIQVAKLARQVSDLNNVYGNMPATGQFYIQRTTKIGNYPLASAYANFHLKQTRFFIEYYHMSKCLW